MEYEKQIEIKIDGNKCIINIPQEQNPITKSPNKMDQPNNNILQNMDDVSLSISLTSEPNMNSKNNFYEMKNNKSILYSNEKSKLEITYKSIFYSDLKSESSNMKTPLLLLNIKDNIDLQQKKDSVIKRLNFDSTDNTNKNLINNQNTDNKFEPYNVTKLNNSVSNKKKELQNENKKITNSDIPNINIRKLPLLNRNNFAKNISKNLNKEYFIYEKIYSSNKNENDDSGKRNIRHLKLDRKKKDIGLNKGQINNNTKGEIKNNSCINDNSEIPNIDIHSKIDNTLNKVHSKIFHNNKNKKSQDVCNNTLNSNLYLNKCASKLDISNMRQKLNHMMKFNTKTEKEKENYNFDNITENNIDKESEIISKIRKKHEQFKAKMQENKELYPKLTSTKSFNTATKTTKINSFNLYNKSAKVNKLVKNSERNNNNSNLKTPSSIVNKQLILCTPQTNSHSCSTSFSAKINKSPNTNTNTKNNNYEIKCNDSNLKNNIIDASKGQNNTKKDPILCKMEEHNTLLKNFFLNPTNLLKPKKGEEYLGTYNSINNKNGNEKKLTNENLDESELNRQIKLQKFNTDFKIPVKKTKKLGLLTERNFININTYDNNAVLIKYHNENENILKKEE